MKLVTSLTLLAALVAASPAVAAEAPCDTDAAVNSLLCNAWRPTPGIQATPTAPRIGSPVVLETSVTSRGSTFAWDLDGDGQFDDATGTKVTRTFNGGTPRVGVRETDQFGRTGTETLTLALHAFNASPSGQVEFSAGSARAGRPVTVTAVGSDPDGQIDHVDLDLDGDGTFETAGAEHAATYATAGTRVVRARFTDDAGATATASATIDVHTENLLPHAQLQIGQANGMFDESKPLAVGGAIINAFVSDPDATIARIDFDLDGDGTYETPAKRLGDTPSGEIGTATTTFAAGDYEIGVRVTDSDGATSVTRRTLIVGDTTRPLVLPTFAGMIVRPGVPTTLGGGPNAGVTYTWDTDGDGEFDDGTGTIQLTYPAPGEYTVRVKATGPGGERIGMATVSAREAPALPPVLGPLLLPPALRAGKAVGFDAGAGTADGMRGDVDLTFDLDGDGQFDDQPSGQFGYTWTFPGPADIAVKATDGEMRTAVRTAQLSPVTQNLGPLAGWVAFSIGFPSPDSMGEPAFLAGKVSTLDGFGNDVDGGGCCTLAWDADGNGDYGDGSGNELKREFSAGEHTVGVRATDTDGDSSTMTRTFTVGTHPPKASFAVSGSTVTSTSTDPDGDAIASVEWDLDGDRAFDDATGPSARALEGAHLVGVKVTDPTGDIGITYADVTGDALPPQSQPQPQPQPRDDGAIWRIAQNPLELTVVAGRTPKLASVLKSGLSVTVRCSASCRTTVVASVDKKTAKKLHLRSRNVGRGIGFGAAVRVKLNAESKRAFKRVKSVRLLLTMTAVGSDGLGAAASRTLTLTR